jgi:uncharacterized protein YceK
MRLALLIAVGVAASGCASVSNEAPAGLSAPDSARMSAIESQAARYGTRVYWINPPLKPASRDVPKPREGT